MRYKVHETNLFSGIMFHCICFLVLCTNAVKEKYKVRSVVINGLKGNGEIIIKMYVNCKPLAWGT
jgi:hypothetical protein